MLLSWLVPPLPQALAQQAAPHDVDAFYQFYRSDPDSIEDYVRIELASTISAGKLRIQANPFLDAFVLRDSDIRWRAMVNFAGGTWSGERDVSEEAAYDDATGVLTLPASYAREHVSFVVQLPWMHPAHRLVAHWQDGPSYERESAGQDTLLLPQTLSDMSAGKVYPIRNVVSDVAGSSSPWMLGKDYDTHNLATLCGYPEMEGRYGFFVAFQKNSCELFELLDAVPGRPGANGVVTTDYGDVIERNLAGYAWTSADCVEEVNNGREIFFVLEDAGSWVRIDAIEGSLVHCTFRLSVDGPGGVNYQDVMGKFDLDMPYGGLRITKRSSNPNLTDGNEAYSLAGARYEVYANISCVEHAGTLVTDERGQATLEGLVAGTYWIRETLAPPGYALDQTTYQVTVTPGQVEDVGGETVFDVPLHAIVDLTVQKADGEDMDVAQGDGILTDAKMRVDYYDGFYEHATSLPTQAKRSWTISTADLGGGLVAIRFGDVRCEWEGDAFFEDDGRQVLPLGTIAVTEIAAPTGYRLSDPASHLMHVVADPAAPGGARIEKFGAWGTHGHKVDAWDFAIDDQVVRGGARLGKVDAQSLRHLAQGAATLEGAVLAIELVSEKPVLVDGVRYAQGEVVTTVALSADGIGETAADALPYGTYVAYETTAPEGYELCPRETWSKTFAIREQGAVVDLSDEVESVPNRVRRGDLSFTKVAERSMRRLAGVPFVIRSSTTGEAHVVVTDENGSLSTSAAWTPHTHNTNSNDAAMEHVDGAWRLIDDRMLDPDSGLWFCGYADLDVAPDDQLGALPYDSYTITELPARANDGLSLVSFAVTIRRQGTTVDCGTISDRPAPSIATELTDSTNGTHTSAPSDHVVLLDSVGYSSLTPGTEYALEGSLRLLGEKGDTRPLRAVDGNPIVARTTFVPLEPDGSTTVEFSFDASSLAGRSVVAFETLSSGESVVAIHEDEHDVAQTVSFAALTTMFSDAGEKIVAGTGMASVIDNIQYQGLTPGATYTVQGSLLDRSTGAPAQTGTGNPIRGGTTFVAENGSGSVDVQFDFDASEQGGRTLVAAETLATGETAIVIHADLDNDAQTVVIPAITTKAVVASSGTNEARATSDTIIVDTVNYYNLIPNETYELVTTLVNPTTGETILGDDDRPAMRVTFTAAEADGEIEISIPLDASGLAGSDVTVFEYLYKEGRLLAQHADQNSREQRVSFPSIDTEAFDARSGTHEMTADKDGSVVDSVTYRNLTPGVEYVLTGTLHRRGDDGKDGGILTDASGHNAARALTFIPESKDGSLRLTFDVDSGALAGDSIVAFEQIVREGAGVVAEHVDIESKSQEVAVVSARTTPSALPRTDDIAKDLSATLLVAFSLLLLGKVCRAFDGGRHDLTQGGTQRARTDRWKDRL